MQSCFLVGYISGLINNKSVRSTSSILQKVFIHKSPNAHLKCDVPSKSHFHSFTRSPAEVFGLPGIYSGVNATLQKDSVLIFYLTTKRFWWTQHVIKVPPEKKLTRNSIFFSRLHSQNCQNVWETHDPGNNGLNLQRCMGNMWCIYNKTIQIKLQIKERRLESEVHKNMTRVPISDNKLCFCLWKFW